MSWSLIHHLMDWLTPGALLGAVLIFFTGSFAVDFLQRPTYPKSLPRVGHSGVFLGTLRDWVGYVTQFDDWVRTGYYQYSKHDRSFVVPSAASRPPEIVIPRSQTTWMLGIPDGVLSSKAAHDDVMYSEYSFLGTDDEFSVSTIRRHLARNLLALIPRAQEEIEDAVEGTFGTDCENWKELNLWEAWLGVVPRVTNLLLVGRPTCRNQAFLDAQVAYADFVAMMSFILNMFPKVLLPVVGPTLSMLAAWHWRKTCRLARPFIEETLVGMRQKAAGDPEYRDWQCQETMVTWLIRQAMLDGRHELLNARDISKLLLPVEFAAIHTTMVTLHSLMLDLLSADPLLGYVESIREETTRVLKECGGRWTKQGLSRLYRTDSAIRESMRISHMATSLVHRKVVAPDGITNPTEGWHAPQGSYLMLHLACLHHDADIYPHADMYDAFRFSRPRETFESRPAAERKQDAAMGLAVKRLAMTATSDIHMAFGHSRHACPGRFFAAHEIKMVLSCLLQNYDVKHLPERPKPTCLGQTTIPPVQAKIQVRRRKRM